jgi:Ca-activated chloride channel homolog
MEREADVQIYTIGIFEPIESRGRTLEEMDGPAILSDIAEESGGGYFEVEKLGELAEVATRIGIELCNQSIARRV